MMSEADLREALRKCKDPELGIDVVNLGLIYRLDISPEKILVVMTLTTPGCPLIPYFRQEIITTVQQASGVNDVDIELTFDPPWDPSKMSDDARKQLTMMR